MTGSVASDALIRKMLVGDDDLATGANAPVDVDAPGLVLTAVPTNLSGERDRSTASNDAVGPVVAAVELELAMIGARERRPGLSEACVTLGHLLDNPKAQSQWASATRALQRGLDELHQGADTRQGRLAAVQRMTERGGPDAG
jgi:hypothetical protein